MEKMIRFFVRKWKGEEIDPEAGPQEVGKVSDDPALEKDLNTLWLRAGTYKTKTFEPDVEANWQKFRARIETKALVVESPVRTLVPRPWLLGAASVALLITLVFVLAPKISDNSKLKTLVTNKNQIKKIVLPDQSIVWLNNSSEINFDQNLNQQKVRKVKLRGEAFFEVQPDPARPFQVETPHGLVEVLGTSFNVRGLKTEPQTEVQVMHGLVALQGKEKKTKRMEVPANFVGFISANTGQLSKDITQNKLVFASTQAWRTRNIKLEQRTLAEAQEIMRRYTNYRLEFSDPHLATCVFTWTLQLDKPEASLQLLAQGGIFQLQRTSPGVFRLVGKACPK